MDAKDMSGEGKHMVGGAEASLDALRSQWWQDLSAAVLRRFLSSQRNAEIHAWANSSGSVSKALIVLQIAMGEIGVKSLQQIRKNLVDAQHPELPSSDGVEALINSVLETLRRSPSTDVLAVDLMATRQGLIAWWCAARTSVIGAAETGVEVRTRWSIGDDPDVLRDLTSHSPRVFGEYLRNGVGPSVGVSLFQQLSEYHSKQINQAAEEEFSESSVRLPEGARSPQHLKDFLVDLTALRFVAYTVERQRDALLKTFGFQALASLESELLRRKLVLAEVIDRLTDLEVSLLESHPDDTPFQDACLERYFCNHTYETAAPGSVPDVGARGSGDPIPSIALAGMVSAPEWMTRRIISEGYWSFHTRLGALPWWYATVEDQHGVEAVRRIHEGAEYALGISKNAEDVCEVQLLLPRDSSGLPRISVSYYYDLRYIEGACELLLLARAGVVRVDFLRAAAGDVTPRIMTSLSIRVAGDIVEASAKRATKALRALTGGDPSAVLPGLWPVDDDEQGAIAFIAAEHAKGEDLDDALGHLVGEPGSSPLVREAWRAVQKAEIAHARARRDLVEAYLSHGESDTRLKRVARAAEERVRNTRAVLRGHNQPERRAAAEDTSNPSALLAPVLRALGGDDRAMAHLILIEPDRPQVAWARTDGGSTRSGLIRLPDLNMMSLRRAIEEWINPVDGKPAYEAKRGDQLRRWLVAIAGPLRDVMTSEGVRHLVLSPTWLLDLLPLHAAPVSTAPDAPLLFDCFDSVTYAPTARVLERLTRLPDPLPDDHVVMAAYGNDLPGIDLEARMIRHLRRGATLFRGDAATPTAVLSSARAASVIHIASHCVNEADHFASGLLLSPADGGSGRLTVAHLLEAGDFRGVRLALLASCGSGAYPRTELAFQHYRAVDSAFLARGARAALSTLWPVSDVMASVFMTMLHAGLASGEHVVDAHRRAVDYLRFAKWRSETADHVNRQAEEVLDAEQPSWAEDLDIQIGLESLPSPRHWAGYRLTGLLW
ncbi:CHAT domain-containing protein [Streptomyces sp. NPDC049040]|uniref:CHAT domain-containing protein n=1 Tax=Streptomyces sp. NPDC049040 TaxID=3365593 RepID=UPI00371ED01A